MKSLDTGYFSIELKNPYTVTISDNCYADELNIKDVNELIEWLQTARKSMLSYVVVDSINYTEEEARQMIEKLKKQLGES